MRLDSKLPESARGIQKVSLLVEFQKRAQKSFQKKGAFF